MTISAAVSGPIPPAPQPVPLVPAATASGNGPSFGDLLDAVNPLQHIPLLSNLYRAATGSQISTASQLAGDTLYGALLPGGAIVGFASSLADVAVRQAAGKDIGQLVVGAVTPSSAPPAATALIPKPTLLAPQTAGNLPTVPLVHLSHNTQASNSQYQRVQAFDALNSKLLKMAV